MRYRDTQKGALVLRDTGGTEILTRAPLYSGIQEVQILTRAPYSGIQGRDILTRVHLYSGIQEVQILTRAPLYSGIQEVQRYSPGHPCTQVYLRYRDTHWCPCTQGYMRYRDTQKGALVLRDTGGTEILTRAPLYSGIQEVQILTRAPLYSGIHEVQRYSPGRPCTRRYRK